MKRLLLFICLLAGVLSAENKNEDLPLSSPFEISDLSCGKEFLVGGLINPLSGQICLNKTDLVAKGAQEIAVDRVYVPPYLATGYHRNPDLDKAERYARLQMNYRGFVTFPHRILNFNYRNGNLKLVDQNGSVLEFKKAGGDYVFANLPYGISNLAGDKPSGQFDVRNIKIENSGDTYVVSFPDGTRRHYQGKFGTYVLKKEILPSGKVIRFCSRGGEITKIESLDPQERYIYATVDVKGSFEGGKQEFLASNGAFATYTYETRELRAKGKEGWTRFEHMYRSRPYLTSAEGTNFEKEFFTYTDDLWLSEHKSSLLPFVCKEGLTKIRGSLPQFRVNNLVFPVASDKSFNGWAQIHYYPPLPGKLDGSTTVRYPDGSRIDYSYTNQLLANSIKSFAPDGTLKKTKIYQWNEDNRAEKIQLFEGSDQLLYEKSYDYDGFGNPVLETISGNISGTTASYWIERSYSTEGRNLLLREFEENGKETVYAYLPETSLPLSKLILDQSGIFQREFWEYDDCHNLTKKIIDNGSSLEQNDLTGVTERRMTIYTLRSEDPFLHMPEWIEEKYSTGEKEETVKKIHLSYDQYGNVCQEDVYDSEGLYRYSLQKEYDERGNLVSETNALGQTAAYQYNKNGYLVSSVSFSGRLKKDYAYDLRGRLISESHTGCDGSQKTYHYEYDSNDKLIQKTVNETNITRYEPDPITLKPLTVVYPSVGEEKVAASFQYDALGREISKTDPAGQTTLITRNLYGSPLQIIHPDGLKEEYAYSKEGFLLRHVDREGIITEYERDILGRALTKTLYLPSGEKLAAESFVYNAFHLLQETDREGYTTTYHYDGAGRKVKEEREGRIIEYLYDSLGRLALVKKINGNNTLFHRFEYDLQDRVVRETKADNQDQILYQVGYDYDEDGNRSLINRCGGAETFSYDAFGRLKERIDPQGNAAVYSYDDWWKNSSGCHVLRKTAVDPYGKAAVTVYDPFDRMASEQVFDSKGTTLSYTEHQYDRSGNLTAVIDDIYEEGRYQRTQTTGYEYNEMGQLQKETRGQGTSQKRETHYTYNPRGKLASKTLPSGETLFYTYNALGFIESLKSSDGSVNLTYRTNKLGDLIEASDDNSLFSITREFDPFGNILREAASNGLYIEKSYDHFDRPISIKFPDGIIAYEYDPLYLRSVKRMSPEKQLLYEHTYDAYDQSGILIRESLIGGLGSAEYQYDENGRKLSAISPYYTQNCLYDEKGNLIEAASDGTSEFYRYDALSQLISENETSYSYDSHFNRIKKDDEKLKYNDLDELVSKGGQTYEYDLNGNLTHDGETAFKYDHLNRLTEARKDGRKAIYRYDPLGRRISKEVFFCIEEQERPIQSEIYLYDGDDELASYVPNLYLKHLKVAGLSLGNKQYQPVAIELPGGIFAPILDVQGNVKKLVEIESKKITHEYIHSAFGEAIDIFESCFNPWRCSGKRFDPETGLIYFGKRYYNPRIARWMTTDPAGTHDSSNLYQYLFNNPLKYCDPDGRFVFVIAIPVVEIFCGAAIMDTLILAVAAGATAWAVHEGGHYVENWVNQQFRDGVPYGWDDLGWDPRCPNIEGFEWKGNGPPSEGQGNWFNEETKESYHPDLEHGPPHGPHWDYKPDKKHKGYRIYPDGRIEEKKPNKK